MGNAAYALYADDIYHIEAPGATFLLQAWPRQKGAAIPNAKKCKAFGSGDGVLQRVGEYVNAIR